MLKMEDNKSKKKKLKDDKLEKWRKNSAINGERDFIDFRLICSFLKSIMWCCTWYQVFFSFCFLIFSGWLDIQGLSRKYPAMWY